MRSIQALAPAMESAGEAPGGVAGWGELGSEGGSERLADRGDRAAAWPAGVAARVAAGSLSPGAQAFLPGDGRAGVLGIFPNAPLSSTAAWGKRCTAEFVHY